MSEDKNLLSRISQLAGQINLHKGQTVASEENRVPTRLWPSSSSSSLSKHAAHPVRASSQGYLHGLGRPTKAAFHPYRNRSLVLKQNPTPQSASMSKDDLTNSGSSSSSVHRPNTDQVPSNNWIAKQGRHAQLINASVYEKETTQRNKAIEQTRQQRILRRDKREKQKIRNHFQGIASPAATSPAVVADLQTYSIYIGGLQFQVCDGGSKLLRLRSRRFPSLMIRYMLKKYSGSFDSMKATPRTAIIGGVTFYRSKNGNLYRSGLVKGAKKMNRQPKKIQQLCPRFATTGTQNLSLPACDIYCHCLPLLTIRIPYDGQSLTVINYLGHCSKGPLCPYIHDASKVAICQTYLSTGLCPAGVNCDLSHDLTPQRVPACVHFLHGRCSKPDCRYAHVLVSPTAVAICRPFATLGFCSKGAACEDRHVFECPDYASTGKCHNQKCRLRHVDRAGQIRQHAPKSGADVSGQPVVDESDLSSEEDDVDEADSEDVDSDGLEDCTMLIRNTLESNILAEQQDFVHF